MLCMCEKNLLLNINYIKLSENLFLFCFFFFCRGSRPVASSKPAPSTKTVAFDLPPWQNQPTENGDTKIEVSLNYISIKITIKIFH